MYNYVPPMLRFETERQRRPLREHNHVGHTFATTESRLQTAICSS